jgi:ADP-ribosyl-[dinitrogen reductase] hydrolase
MESDDFAMYDFTLLKFNDEVLQQYGLTDLPCPVRVEILDQVLAGGIQLTLLADECELFLEQRPESKEMFAKLYARLNYIAGVIAGQSGEDEAAAMYLVRAYKIYIGNAYEAPQLVFETASKYASALNKLNRFKDALFVFDEVFFIYGSVEESSFAFWQEAIDLNYQRGNTSRTITLLEHCIEKIPEKFPEDIRTSEESLRDKAIRYLARTYQDKFQYTGERNEAGEYHGKGTLLDHSDGSKCSGEWQNGIMHGHGTITSPGKFTYVGEWKDGKYHGKGTVTVADGRIFKGHWEYGQLEGWGIYTDAEGNTIYNGQWHKGQKHGRGKICDKGIIYEGEFADNKFNGMGILTYEGGERFEGEFADDNFVNGILYLPSGTVVWKNGEAVDAVTEKEQKKDQPATQKIDAEDRYRGVMVGLAVGDAMGMPLEFLKKEEIKARYNGVVRDYVKPKAGHLCEHLKPGQYTDDTQMALALANSILDKGEFSPHSFKRRLVEWYHCKDHRAPGHACIESVRRLDDGVSWKESGQKDAAGCGSAMRVAPLALAYGNIPLVEHSTTQSIMTHQDCRATIGSILTAAIIGILLERDCCNFDRDSFLALITRVADYFEDKFELEKKEFTDLLKKFPEFLVMKFDDGIQQIGTSGYVLQTVLAAFYAFLQTPTDFETTIINAVNQGDDADSIGAIAGAFSGALNGMQGIPARWVNGLEKKDEIVTIADNLLKIKGKVQKESV